MTAVVSREHARGAGLTGAAGGLLIAIASAMMVVAAPGHGHDGPRGLDRGPVRPAAVQLATPAAVQLATDAGEVTRLPPGTFRPWAQARSGAF